MLATEKLNQLKNRIKNIVEKGETINSSRSTRSNNKMVDFSKLNELKDKLEKIKKKAKPDKGLPVGVVEAPQNIPENESGKLKIITE